MDNKTKQNWTLYMAAALADSGVIEAPAKLIAEDAADIADAAVVEQEKRFGENRMKAATATVLLIKAHDLLTRISEIVKTGDNFSAESTYGTEHQQIEGLLFSISEAVSNG